MNMTKTEIVILGLWRLKDMTYKRHNIYVSLFYLLWKLDIKAIEGNKRP